MFFCTGTFFPYAGIMLLAFVKLMPFCVSLRVLPVLFNWMAVELCLLEFVELVVVDPPSRNPLRSATVAGEVSET